MLQWSFPRRLPRRRRRRQPSSSRLGCDPVNRLKRIVCLADCIVQIMRLIAGRLIVVVAIDRGDAVLRYRLSVARSYGSCIPRTAQARLYRLYYLLLHPDLVILVLHGRSSTRSQALDWCL